MVRLKDFAPIPAEHNILFQFQMVRLKAIKELNAITGKLVSIPNGTIKSHCCTVRRGVHIHVSIPNGTIKRKNKEIMLGLITSFQFQMVRLKASTLKKYLH